MTDWTECRIGKVVALQQGLCINSKSKHLLSEDGHVLLRITDLINNTEAQYISRQKLPPKFLSSPNEIIYTRTGQVGLVFKGRIGVVHNNCFKVIPSKELNHNFLFWVLKSQYAYGYANSVASGAAQPDLGHAQFKSMYIRYPDKKTQLKIAAILTAYDDLIETNKRRIALLEKMAEEIYREWFVRMRFPGYQNTKFVKGVPEGWDQTQLGEIAQFTMGQSPKSEYYNEIGEGLPFHQGVGTYGNRFPITTTYCSVDGRRAAKGDILFSVRAPVGRLNIADCDMTIGRGLAAITHLDGKNSYLFYLLKTVFTSEDIIGNGAIFNSVSKSELSGLKIYWHPKKLVDMFEDVACPIDHQIETLTDVITNLTQTRDLLLPRLISGKLSVKDLDIQFPPSMQEDVPTTESSNA